MTTDYHPTGRVVEGPDARLIELHQGGHAAMALVHREPFRAPDVVEEVVKIGEPFLTNPMVAGVVELDAWQPEDHLLLYPSGRAWCIAEILDQAGEGQPLGVRAGLELAYQGALLLQEASTSAEDSGVPIHGNPTPWRWLFDETGDLHLIGWGVPGLELYHLDREPDLLLPTACYQYLSPERLRSVDEDLSSDLFTLSLIAAQIMLGEPVYDGSTTAVRALAERADGERRLYAHRHDLSLDIQRFFSRAIDPYRDGRFDDIEDYIRGVHDLLYGPLAVGPTLADQVLAHRPPTPDLPQPTAPAAPQQKRWEPVQRDAPRAGPGIRPVVDVPAPDPDQAQRLRSQRHSSDRRTAADMLRERLAESQKDRDAALRERLGTFLSSRRARMRDRTALFPSRPIEGQILRYRVEPPEGGQRWVRLGPDESLARSAARVADQSQHTPIGPTGSIEGWFRLTQGGAAWFGCTETRVLDASQPVQLEVVPNQLIDVEISIHQDEAPVKLQVGTAVHARFLVGYLRHRFELHARDWSLFAQDDQPLDDWQILDDFELADGASLRLRRVRAPSRQRRRRA